MINYVSWVALDKFKSLSLNFVSSSPIPFSPNHVIASIRVKSLRFICLLLGWFSLFKVLLTVLFHNPC